MERFSPSTTVSVKASPICICTSCLAIEMMASGASFGPDSATKMKQPSSICRKHFDLLLPGSSLLDCKMYRNIRNGNNARWQSGMHTPSPMAPTFFTQLLTYCLKYTMRTMQSCLVEIMGFKQITRIPVGADLSRTPPIYRPLLAVPVSRLIC